MLLACSSTEGRYSSVREAPIARLRNVGLDAVLLHGRDPVVERFDAVASEQERAVVARREPRRRPLLLGHMHGLHLAARVRGAQLEREPLVVPDDADVLERDEAGGRDVLGRLEVVENVALPHRARSRYGQRVAGRTRGGAREGG